MAGPHAARIGQQIGAYVLERLLGRGGMSLVFFARHRVTGQSAAIKILQRGLPENIVAARRLEQEARTIARIDHPHVVRLYDAGRTPDGLPYFAMEYLEGESLARVFARHGRLPVPRMIEIVRQMLSALQEAHALDIVHRDIKPDNVFLVQQPGNDDFVKMLDFGIAKLIGPQPHTAVESVQGVVLGTPEYLSPEVAMDVDALPASDIYAVGVILFEGLTGRLPFTGRTPTQIAEHHCFTPPPSPRSFVPDLPVELERIVLRCLNKDPAERYRDAEALTQALRAIGGLAPAAPPDRSATDELPRIVGGDPLDAVEDTIRRALREPDGPRLAALDVLAARTEALDSERDALLAKLEGDDGVLDLERALIDALTESESLADEIRRLREALRTEHAPPAGDDDAVALMTAFDLDDTLDPTRRGRLERLERRAPTLEQDEDRRAALASRIEEMVSRRARIDVRCARLEADLLLRRAQETSRRARAQSRLEGLQIEIEALRQRRAREMARLVLRRAP
ncbi:MAG: serine/threonine-protein kinase [bacterium]|nr:protein kinase [Myxococcales bacterium]MCB9541215.1 protein kinase [Myxococcales bacterium]MCB9551223.1 protein kinase [Myxococcales bacterium]